MTWINYWKGFFEFFQCFSSAFVLIHRSKLAIHTREQNKLPNNRKLVSHLLVCHNFLKSSIDKDVFATFFIMYSVLVLHFRLSSNHKPNSLYDFFLYTNLSCANLSCLYEFVLCKLHYTVYILLGVTN